MGAGTPHIHTPHAAHINPDATQTYSPLSAYSPPAASPVLLPNPHTNTMRTHPHVEVWNSAVNEDATGLRHHDIPEIERERLHCSRYTLE